MLFKFILTIKSLHLIINAVVQTPTSTNYYQGVNCPGVKSTPPSRILLIRGIRKGAFTYDVSSRGGGGFEMLAVADKGGVGLSLADVSKNT